MVKVSIYGKPHINYQGYALEKREKKCIIRFTADKTEREKGVFDWDALTKSMIRNCTSDVEQLKKAYTPITVAAEDYYVPYLSLKVGQSITLSLKKSTITLKEKYQSIKINPVPGFTIEPMELKEATEITITCNKNADTVSQLTVTADNDPNPVGALNIWHPTPKTAKVKWVFLETDSRGEDVDDIKEIVNETYLRENFQKAFTPGLIDIALQNTTAEVFDLTTLDQKDPVVQRYMPQIDASCVNGIASGALKYTDADKNRFFNNLCNLYYTKHLKQSDEILLFLTNLECYIPNDDGTKSYTNGVTKTGISMMFLKNEDKDPKVEIPHEIMHAIGLPHTFTEDAARDPEKSHRFKGKSTDNYMDYDNPKKHTYHWQWQELHANAYTK